MSEFDDRYQRLSVTQRELLDRWFAEEPLAAEAATGGPLTEPSTYASPATAAERALVEVWQEVLEVAQVGVDDDYFSLGGDSIHAIVVVAKSEAAGVGISTQDLFEARTIRRLAQRAESPPPEPPAAQPPPERELPLTAMQEGMLFHSVSARQPVYVVQVTCQLVGELDITAFGRAWQAVVDQHPALRCSFRWPAGQLPQQRVEAAVAVAMEHQDWRRVPSAQQRERLQDYLAADLDRGFALEHAPLLRLALLQTTESKHWFVWTHHHLLLDGWSQQLVLQDVLAAYDELRAGRPARVPARGWSAQYLAGSPESAPEDADQFWREYLRGYTEPVPLPGGEPEAAAAGVTATESLSMSEHSHAALSTFCRGHKLPLNTVLQGGWAMALARFAGAAEVVFGATNSGRSAATPGITEAVGMFINTLPVRAAYRPTDRLLPWLRELHERQAATQRYEHTPLPRIVRSSALAGGRPLFETIVVMENFPARLAHRQLAAGLRIEQPESRVDEGYPLVLEVRPGPPLTLRLRYDPTRIGSAGAEALLRQLRGYLTQLPALMAGGPAGPASGDEPSLADLAARIDAQQQRRVRADQAALHTAAAERLRASRRTPVQAAGSQPAEGDRT